MSFHSTFTIILALGCCLAACDHRVVESPKRINYPVRGPSPDDWQGVVSVDPGNDYERLQGFWQLVAHNNYPIKPGIADRELLIDKRQIKFVQVTTKSLNGTPHTDRYTYVVNSTLHPKVIRCLKRLGDDEPYPGDVGPLGMWYRLDGDSLCIWNYWAERNEDVKYVYRRRVAEVLK